MRYENTSQGNGALSISKEVVRLRAGTATARRARALRLAVVETDAVLAAFSHDNTTIGTNTETHTVAFDAVPMSGMLLNATWYLYRPHVVAPGAPRELQHRVRLNATVTF